MAKTQDREEALVIFTIEEYEKLLNENKKLRKELEELQKNTCIDEDRNVFTIDVVRKIFDFWKQVMNSPRAKLDDSRIRLIRKALKNYSPADVCKAIRGCSRTPYNMGENESKTKYNGLSLILRNAEKIDHFLRLDESTPRSNVETVEQKNARARREFLGESTNDDVIEMEPTCDSQKKQLSLT